MQPARGSISLGAYVKTLSLPISSFLFLLHDCSVDAISLLPTPASIFILVIMPPHHDWIFLSVTVAKNKLSSVSYSRQQKSNIYLTICLIFETVFLTGLEIACRLDSQVSELQASNFLYLSNTGLQTCSTTVDYFT